MITEVRQDWVILSELYVSIESVIKDLKAVNPNIWVETVEGVINKFYPDNNQEEITLAQAGKVVKAIARARQLNQDHPAISHYWNYSEEHWQIDNGNIDTTPVSAVQTAAVIEGITYPEYKKSVRLGDAYDGEPCYLEQLEMDQYNWLLAWKNMQRKHYSTPQLQAIIAESNRTNQLIAASLLWVSANPNVEIFKQAAKLAGSSTIDELWQAYYVTPSREGFVAVVLAIVHYELLSTLKVGEYFPVIEVIFTEGEYYRRYRDRQKM